MKTLLLVGVLCTAAIQINAQFIGYSRPTPQEAAEQRIKQAAHEARAANAAAEASAAKAREDKAWAEKYPDEWRCVNGTSYNVGYLKRWRARNLSITVRPLPDWQWVKGTIVETNGSSFTVQQLGVEYRNSGVNQSSRVNTGSQISYRGRQMVFPITRDPRTGQGIFESHQGTFATQRNSSTRVIVHNAAEFAGYSEFLVYRISAGEFDCGKPCPPPASGLAPDQPKKP